MPRFEEHAKVQGRAFWHAGVPQNHVSGEMLQHSRPACAVECLCQSRISCIFFLTPDLVFARQSTPANPLS